MDNLYDINDRDLINDSLYSNTEYEKIGDASRREKAKSWGIAIGLQEVDNLKTSKYLRDIARSNIDDEIDFKEVRSNLSSYYKSLGERKDKEISETYEADIVSAHIAELLSDDSFTFSPVELLNIHNKLFSDVYDHAGTIRDYNITKAEWVLDGDTVTYSSYDSIMDTLKYDFEEEMKFSYRNLSISEIVKHLAKFISNLWQVHPFCEGNTRTIAVFIIKYLKTFGFDITDELFSINSWYFRNALVRCNYRNYSKNVYEDYTYLEKFLSNLIGGTNYELKNRFMHIHYDKEKDTYKRKDIKESNSEENNKLTHEEQLIVDMIRTNPEIKTEIMASNIGKSKRTVVNRLHDLQEREIIRRTNSKKKPKWEII